MHTKKGPNGNPLDWKFAKVRVLVVDEGSLVCVQILSSLLSMLTKYAQLQKFIILGEVKWLVCLMAKLFSLLRWFDENVE